jgi:hypothetical protein
MLAVFIANIEICLGFGVGADVTQSTCGMFGFAAGKGRIEVGNWGPAMSVDCLFPKNRRNG